MRPTAEVSSIIESGSWGVVPRNCDGVTEKCSCCVCLISSEWAFWRDVPQRACLRGRKLLIADGLNELSNCCFRYVPGRTLAFIDMFPAVLSFCSPESWTNKLINNRKINVFQCMQAAVIRHTPWRQKQQISSLFLSVRQHVSAPHQSPQRTRHTMIISPDSRPDANRTPRHREWTSGCWLLADGSCHPARSPVTVSGRGGPFWFTSLVFLQGPALRAWKFWESLEVTRWPGLHRFGPPSTLRSPVKAGLRRRRRRRRLQEKNTAEEEPVLAADGKRTACEYSRRHFQGDAAQWEAHNQKVFHPRLNARYWFLC